jgi:hypothetical protein
MTAHMEYNSRLDGESKVGKEALIKVVTQTIPPYDMSCFDLTKSFCDGLSMMICQYFGGVCWVKIKPHWLSWDKLLQPRRDGGLGFWDLHHFYLAMLAQQGWRLAQNSKSLCGISLA